MSDKSSVLSKQKPLHHCSFLWDRQSTCSVHKSNQQMHSDSLFVLNYLDLCLKGTPGTFRHRRCQAYARLCLAYQSSPSFHKEQFVPRTVAERVSMEKKDKEEFLMKSLVENGLLKAGNAFLTLRSPLTLPESKSKKSSFFKNENFFLGLPAN